jgi:ech hydrogenase subunit D
MRGDVQEVRQIEAEHLLPQVQGLKQDGFRLVQVDCIRGQGFELNYSFANGLRLVTLRVLLSSEGPKIPSIGELYFCGALYENELHDLFGVQIEGLALDYRGTFYRTKVKTPYSVASPPSGQTDSAQKEGT